MRFRCFIFIFAAMMSFAVVNAQTGPGVPSDASAVPANVKLEEPKLKRDKLPLEQQCKVEIEEAKLEEQRRTARLTMLTVVVTALGVLGTFFYNIRNTNYQARVQAKIKALEVITSAAGPRSAKERLAIVKKLLGSELIDPTLADDLVARGVGQGHDQNRRELIRMLLEYPDKRGEALLLWRIAFKETSLENNINAMEEALGLGNTQHSGQPNASSGQPASPSAR